MPAIPCFAALHFSLGDDTRQGNKLDSRTVSPFSCSFLCNRLAELPHPLLERNLHFFRHVRFLRRAGSASSSLKTERTHLVRAVIKHDHAAFSRSHDPSLPGQREL